MTFCFRRIKTQGIAPPSDFSLPVALVDIVQISGEGGGVRGNENTDVKDKRVSKHRPTSKNRKTKPALVTVYISGTDEAYQQASFKGPGRRS